MQKWKCATIILNCLNAFLLFAGIHDYYEFFNKKCRDAFPFHYYPWGSLVLNSHGQTTLTYFFLTIFYFALYMRDTGCLYHK